MIRCVVQFLCFLAQIPGILAGNHVNIFCGGFCFAMFLEGLFEEVL